MSSKCRAKDPSTCRTHGQPQSASLNDAVEKKDVSRYLSARESMENDTGNASRSVEAVTKLVAEEIYDIARFKVSLGDDGNGPYIRMDEHNKDKSRYLYLDSGDDANAPPTWRYRNDGPPYTHQYNSYLGKEATVKEVQKFLFKSFGRESNAEETRDMLKTTWVPTRPRWPERSPEHMLLNRGTK